MSTPAAARFWAKVQEGDRGCWLWTGALSGGYGQFYAGRERGGVKAHRWAYEQMVGEIPEGLELDHLCRVRSCVNPSHLDPVTGLVNVRRSPLQPGARTHCTRGHEYTEANTYNNSGRRYCRACNRIRVAEHRAAA